MPKIISSIIIFLALLPFIALFVSILSLNGTIPFYEWITTFIIGSFIIAPISAVLLFFTFRKEIFGGMKDSSSTYLMWTVTILVGLTAWIIFSAFNYLWQGPL